MIDPALKKFRTTQIIIFSSNIIAAIAFLGSYLLIKEITFLIVSLLSFAMAFASIFVLNHFKKKLYPPQIIK
ncbi:MAG: hypothetical protein NT007_19270 [Candidatus Kapabacteria bacterium]|nr:hypothetical protein [Candidatus Kapabacteria bacterium]